MIQDLGSYSVDRFVPFLAESYFRLFERQNEALFPGQFLLGALGVAAVVLAWAGKGRMALPLLAVAFAVVAVTFHFPLYAELTPVGTVFGWVFLAQAGLLVAVSLFDKREPAPPRSWASRLGLVLAMAAMVGFPLMARVTGRTWAGAEYFGAAPEPTVIAALGVVLMTGKPRWFLSLFPLPLLWCAVSGATLHVLEAPFAWALPGLGLLALTAGLAKAWLPARA